MPDLTPELKELYNQLDDPLYRYRTKQHDDINWRAYMWVGILTLIIISLAL